jgi:hypothetical protein
MSVAPITIKQPQWESIKLTKWIGEISALAGASDANSVSGSSYGVTANGQFVYDGACTSGSNIVSSATAKFAESDIGKIIFGATGTGIAAQSTIVSVLSSNSVLISTNATESSTGMLMGWGTDDSLACANAWAAAQAAGQYLALPSGFIFVQYSLFNPISNTPTNQMGLYSLGFSTLVPTPNFDFTTIPGSTNGMFFNCEFESGLYLFPNNAYLSNIGVFGGGQTLSGGTHSCSIFSLGQAHVQNLWIWNYGNADTSLVAVTATGPANFDGLYIYVAGAVGLRIEGSTTQVVALYNGSYSSAQPISLQVSNGLLNSYGSYWGQTSSNPAVSVAVGAIFNSYGDQFTGGAGGTGARSIDALGTVNLSGAQVVSNANQYGFNIGTAGRVNLLGGCQINLSAASAIVAEITGSGVLYDDGTTDYIAGTTPAAITSATAGSATLPIAAVGFKIIDVNGSPFKIPYYNL